MSAPEDRSSPPGRRRWWRDPFVLAFLLGVALLTLARACYPT